MLFDQFGALVHLATQFISVCSSHKLYICIQNSDHIFKERKKVAQASMSKMEEEMKEAEEQIKVRKEETEKSKVLGASIRCVNDNVQCSYI